MKIKDLFMLSRVEAQKACPVVNARRSTTGVDRPREKQIKNWNRAKKQMLVEGKLGYNVLDAN